MGINIIKFKVGVDRLSNPVRSKLEIKRRTRPFNKGFLKTVQRDGKTSAEGLGTR